MKKAAILFCLLVTLAVVTQAQNHAFKAGERITYTVYYNVIGLYVNAGTATFTTSKSMYNNHEVFHVVGEGVTNSRYDWIFKVRDRYESYFRTDDFKPLKFIRNVNEGGYKKYEVVTFNHDENVAITNKGVRPVPDQVQDVISFLYYARSIDFDNYKKGDKITFNMFLGEKVYHMYVRYMGRETVTTKYGKFKALALKPLLLEGNAFAGGEDMTMWITDDPNHLPVRIESPISVGKIKVDLMHFTDIKYPLTSLIKRL
jgi:hypothetical protein